jgi:hypothetical protein
MEKSKPKKLERCLHQVFPPEVILPSSMRNGCGNCKICEYDYKNNPKCPEYTPVQLHMVEVEEKIRIFYWRIE